MRERLIVNFLKQLIMFGIEILKEDIRSQLLRGYAKLEPKIPKPKSLHYLLQLYKSPDSPSIPQMLQHFIKQEKVRSRKDSGEEEDFMLDEGAGGADDFLGSLRKPTRA